MTRDEKRFNTIRRTIVSEEQKEAVQESYYSAVLSRLGSAIKIVKEVQEMAHDEKRRMDEGIMEAALMILRDAQRGAQRWG